MLTDGGAGSRKGERGGAIKMQRQGAKEKERKRESKSGGWEKGGDRTAGQGTDTSDNLSIDYGEGGWLSLRPPRGGGGGGNESEGCQGKGVVWS